MTDFLLALSETDPDAAAWTLLLLVAVVFLAWYRSEQKRLRDMDKTLPEKRTDKPLSLRKYGKGKR